MQTRSYAQLPIFCMDKRNFKKPGVRYSAIPGLKVTSLHCMSFQYITLKGKTGMKS